MDGAELRQVYDEYIGRACALNERLDRKLRGVEHTEPAVVAIRFAYFVDRQFAAAVVLEERGFGRECAPLVRAVLEHCVLLAYAVLAGPKKANVDLRTFLSGFELLELDHQQKLATLGLKDERIASIFCARGTTPQDYMRELSRKRDGIPKGVCDAWKGVNFSEALRQVASKRPPWLQGILWELAEGQYKSLCVRMHPNPAALRGQVHPQPGGLILADKLEPEDLAVWALPFAADVWRIACFLAGLDPNLVDKV